MSGPVLQSMLILISGVMIAFTEVGAGAKHLLQAVFGLSIGSAPNPAASGSRGGS